MEVAPGFEHADKLRLDFDPQGDGGNGLMVREYYSRIY
jgi:hypothetical protein